MHTMAPKRLRFHLTVTVCAALLTGNALAQDAANDARRAPALTRERIPLNSAVPEYPEDARRDRLEGEARVCFRVDERGEVVRPKISSTTDRVFRKPTLEAIRASTFRPLPPGETASPLETCRTYRYRLDPLEPLYVAEDPPALAAPASDTLEDLTAGAADAARESSSVQAGLAAARADAESAPALETDTLITEASALPPEQPVCRSMTRPGTRIEQTVCYSPEELAEAEEASGNTMRTLQDESRFRDQAVEQSLIRGGHPTGPGLGPR